MTNDKTSSISRWASLWLFSPGFTVIAYTGSSLLLFFLFDFFHKKKRKKIYLKGIISKRKKKELQPSLCSLHKCLCPGHSHHPQSPHLQKRKIEFSVFCTWETFTDCRSLLSAPQTVNTQFPVGLHADICAWLHAALHCFPLHPSAWTHTDLLLVSVTSRP